MTRESSFNMISLLFPPSLINFSPQMSYSLTRFAIYETLRDMLGSRKKSPIPFYQKVMLGAFGGVKIHTRAPCIDKAQALPISLQTGFTGGFVGTPADMVNVR